MRSRLNPKLRLFSILLNSGSRKVRRTFTHQELAAWLAPIEPHQTVRKGLAESWLVIESGSARPGPHFNPCIYRLSDQGADECEAWAATPEAAAFETARRRVIEAQALEELEISRELERAADRIVADRIAVAGKIEKFRRSQAGQMADLIRSFRRPLHLIEIRRVLGWNRAMPGSSVLRLATKKGILIRVGHGIYDAPERAVISTPSMTAQIILLLQVEPMSVFKIAQRLNLDRLKMKRGVFRRLVSDGYVESVGTGLWQLTSSGIARAASIRQRMMETELARRAAISERFK